MILLRSPSSCATPAWERPSAAIPPPFECTQGTHCKSFEFFNVLSCVPTAQVGPFPNVFSLLRSFQNGTTNIRASHFGTVPSLVFHRSTHTVSTRGSAYRCVESFWRPLRPRETTELAIPCHLLPKKDT